jgi:aspartate kinase
VPGILTGDPDLFENVTKMDRLSFREAIEMTYYGAKVIHPKTIQPLQNKTIPLYVKSFIDPLGAGTLITIEKDDVYPPIVVLEKDQTLLHISTKDFSFIAVDHLAHIFGLMDKYRIKVNLMRNSAVSFSICVQHNEHRVPMLMAELEKDFTLLADFGLDMITIRHYRDEQVNELLAGKIVVFEERFRQTLQYVVRDAPVVKHK